MPTTNTTKQSAIAAGVRNAKTTAAAVLVAVCAILAEVVIPLADGDEATSADWTLLLVLAPVVVGLFFARDANKTSAESGAE